MNEESNLLETIRLLRDKGLWKQIWQDIKDEYWIVLLLVVAIYFMLKGMGRI